MRVKAVDVEYAVEDIADREVAIGKIGHRGFEQLAAGDEDEIGIGRREEIFHVRNHVQHLHAAQAGGSVLLGPGGYLLELRRYRPAWATEVRSYPARRAL